MGFAGKIFESRFLKKILSQKTKKNIVALGIDDRVYVFIFDLTHWI